MRILATAAGVLLASASFAATLDAPPPDTRAALRQEVAPTYYVKIDGKQIGPLTLDMVKMFAGAGQFTLQTEVWTPGTQAWKPAADYAEVAALLAAAPAVAQPAAEAAPAAQGAGQAADAGAPAAAEPVIVAQADQAGQPAAAGQAQAQQGDNPPPPPAAQQDVPPPPPQVQNVDDIKYYTATGGQTAGPFTIDEVKAKIKDGTIKGLTMMWKKGMAAWEPAETLAEVKLAMDETPKPAPFDCAGYTVGTWQKVTLFNGQNVTYTARYEPSGQYSAVHQMQGLPGINMYGTWTATAVGDKSCSLTINQKYPSTGASTVVFDITSKHLVTDKSDNSQINRIQ